MPIDLTGKSIIITGASSGIGRATAIHCAKAGMDLVINARRQHRLEELRDEITATSPQRQVKIVCGDVADEDINRQMIYAASDLPGGLYAVFSNAGYGLHQDITATSMDELRSIFEVNFFAGVDLLRQAAHALIEQNRPGHLMMCSSVIGRFTVPGHGAYSATKAAQAMIAQAMRGELKTSNIYVSSVHPVGTETEFSQAARERGSTPAETPSSTDRVPSLFMQSADRVAKAVVRSLQRPRPEVWTSHIARLAAGMFTISPRLAAFAGDRVKRRKTY